jgi:hypothetical protein
LYNVGGLLDQFWPPTACVRPLKTPFGLVIPLFTIQITRHYNHTIIYYVATRLHNYNHYAFVTTVTYYTLARWHSLRALHSNLQCTIAHKVSITYFASSHFPCLSPSETSLVGLLLTNSSRELTELSCRLLRAPLINPQSY